MRSTEIMRVMGVVATLDAEASKLGRLIGELQGLDRLDGLVAPAREQIEHQRDRLLEHHAALVRVANALRGEAY